MIEYTNFANQKATKAGKIKSRIKENKLIVKRSVNGKIIITLIRGFLTIKDFNLFINLNKVYKTHAKC